MSYHLPTYTSVPLSGLGEVAGEIGGLRALDVDVRSTAAAMRSQWGNVTLDRAVFDAIVRRAQAGNLTTMTPNEVKQFAIGTMDKVAGLLAKARQLSTVNVPDAAGRERVHASQARLLRAARNLWNEVGSAMRNARPATATSGLGLPWLIPVVLFAIVVFAGAAASVHYAEAVAEANTASAEADRVCQEFNGGRPCSAEEWIRYRNALMAPNPLMRLVDQVGTPVAVGVGVGVGVLALGGVAYLWRKSR